MIPAGTVFVNQQNVDYLSDRDIILPSGTGSLIYRGFFRDRSYPGIHPSSPSATGTQEYITTVSETRYGNVSIDTDINDPTIGPRLMPGAFLHDYHYRLQTTSLTGNFGRIVRSVHYYVITFEGESGSINTPLTDCLLYTSPSPRD